MNNKLFTINKFKEGVPIKGFYLCRQKKLKNKKNDELYIDLLLQDNTGMIHGKVWEKINIYKNRFNVGDAIAIKGVPILYQNEMQINITQINKATKSRYSKYGYNINNLIQRSNKSSHKLWKELEYIIKNIKNKSILKLVNSIFIKNKQKIISYPALINNQYYVPGGYLENIISQSKLMNKIKNHYKDMDSDILLASILLINIGLLRKIIGPIIYEYTKEGEFLEISYLSWDIINEEKSMIESFPKNITNKLKYILLSSDKNINPIKCKLPEILIVQSINKLDIDINLFLSKN